MKYKKIAVIGGGALIILLVFASQLYIADYRNILNLHPDADLILLQYNKTGKIELLGKSKHNPEIEFFRWKYEKDIIKTYFGRYLKDTSYWQVFKGSSGVWFNDKQPMDLKYDDEEAQLIFTTRYYNASCKSRCPNSFQGELFQTINIYPDTNKITIEWVPENPNIKYNLRWIHETKNEEAQNLKDFDNIYIGGLRIDWEDAKNQVSWARSYKNGKVKIGFKATAGYQKIDPIIGTYKKSDFLKYKGTYTDIDEGWTWYEICNPTNTDYTIDNLDKLKISFYGDMQYLRDNKLLRGTIINETIKNETKSYTCNPPYWYNYTLNPMKHFWCWYTEEFIINNQTNEKRNKTILIYDHDFETYDANKNTAYWTETIVVPEFYEWKQFSPLGKTLKANTCYDIKVYGKITPSIYSWGIENVPYVFGYEYSEYDWWNNDYGYGYKINSTILNADFPFSVNDTSGIGGGVAYIYTQNKSVMYVYCQNSGCASGNIAIANETDELIWQNQGTQAGNSPTSVWPSTFEAVYTFEDGSGTVINDSTFRHNATVNGQTAPDFVSGVIGNAYDFDGADEWHDTGFSITDWTDITICAWTNHTGGTDTEILFSTRAAGQNNMITMGHYIVIEQNRFECFAYDGSNHAATSPTAEVENQWYHHCCIWNSSGIFLYENGTFVDDDAGSYTGGGIGGANLQIGRRRAGESWYQGQADEIIISNGSLSPTEIQDLYYNGVNARSTTGAEETGPDVVNPNVTLIFPDSDVWNLSNSMSFSGICTDNRNLVNSSIWGNFSGSWALNDTNTSALTNNTQFTIASTIADGYWIWNIECCDSAGNCNQSWSNRTLKIDTVDPTITIVEPFNITYANTTIDIKVQPSETIATWTYEYNSNTTNITFTPNATFVASGNDGTKHIKIFGADPSGRKTIKTAYFSLDATKPNVTLLFPDSNVWNFSNTINFGAKCDEGNLIANASIWGNFSGTWAINDTNTSAITNNTEFTIQSTIADGYWLWNVKCCDFVSNCNISWDNRTLKIDTAIPTLNNFYPSNDTTKNWNNSEFFQIEVTDAFLNTTNVTLHYNLPLQSNFPNKKEMTCGGSSPATCNTTVDLSSYTDGVDFDYFFTATDLAYQIGWKGTPTSAYIIHNDENPPGLTVDSPTNSTYYAYVDLNVSANETIDTWWFEMYDFENWTGITNQTNGLAYNGSDYWVQDYPNNIIHHLDYRLNYIRNCTFNNDTKMYLKGLATGDGTYLWSIDTTNNLLIKMWSANCTQVNNYSMPSDAQHLDEIATNSTDTDVNDFFGSAKGDPQYFWHFNSTGDIIKNLSCSGICSGSPAACSGWVAGYGSDLYFSGHIDDSYENVLCKYNATLGNKETWNLSTYVTGLNYLEHIATPNGTNDWVSIQHFSRKGGLKFKMYDNVTFTPNITFGTDDMLNTSKHITIYANDTSGNKNRSVVYFTYEVDWDPPFYSNNVTSPTSPSNYSLIYYFNCSWNDSLNHVDTIIFNWNGSNVTTNENTCGVRTAHETLIINFNKTNENSTYVYRQLDINKTDFTLTWSGNWSVVNNGYAYVGFADRVYYSHSQEELCNTSDETGHVSSALYAMIGQTGIMIRQCYNGVNFDITGQEAVETNLTKKYYVKFNRSNSDIGLYLYNDEAMTDLNISVENATLATPLTEFNTLYYLSAARRGITDGLNGTFYFDVDEDWNITEVDSSNEIAILYNNVWEKILNISNEYYINITNLKPGNYTYYWWANDSFGYANITPTMDYEVIKATTFVTLYLNGTSANRYYEYDVIANITGIANNNAPVYLSINASKYGSNYTNNNSVIQSLFTTFASIFKFNDTTQIKNLTANNTIYFTIPNRTEFINGSINLTGFESTNISLGENNDVITNTQDVIQSGQGGKQIFKPVSPCKLGFLEIGRESAGNKTLNISVIRGNFDGTEILVWNDSSGNLGLANWNNITFSSNVTLNASENYTIGIDYIEGTAVGLQLNTSGTYARGLYQDGGVNSTGTDALFNIYCYDDVLPTNIQLDIGNDGNIDIRFYGKLNGTTITLSELNDGLITKNLTYNTPGYQTVYFEIGRNVTVSTATFNISGYVAAMTDWRENQTRFNLTNPISGRWHAPSLMDADNDTDNDVFWGHPSGYIYYTENTGTKETPIWTNRGYLNLNGSYTTTCCGGFDIGISNSVIAFADMDNDEDYDMFLSGQNAVGISRVFYYNNSGNITDMNWTLNLSVTESVNVGSLKEALKPAIVDIDGDNDNDMVLGRRNGLFLCYLNNASAAMPDFEVNTTIFTMDVGDKAAPAFYDFDGDGDQDLFSTHRGDSTHIYLYENNGTDSEPDWKTKINVKDENQTDIYVATGYEGFLQFVDLTGDAVKDMVIGTWQGYRTTFYKNLGSLTSPENITIDLGDDGTSDYTYDLELNTSVSPKNVTWNVTAISNYQLLDCTDSLCIFPVKIGTQTIGIIEIDNINITQTINPIQFNITKIKENIEAGQNPTNISIEINASNWGILQLEELDARYKGSIEYNVTAVAEGNENYTIASDSQFLYIRWSNISVTIPDPVYFTVWVPENGTEYNVSPYGQDDATPSFNITGLGYDDNALVYMSLNQSSDSCWGINISNTSNVSDATSMETTRIRVSNQSYNTSNAVWMWLDIMNCASTVTWIDRQIYFDSICDKCVNPW